MREDISSAIPHVAVSLRRIGLHQLENQVAGSWVEERRPLNDTWTFRDLAVQRHGADLRFVEGWLSIEHLENQHAQRVPIDTLVVTRLADNLAGDPQEDQGHVRVCGRTVNGQKVDRIVTGDRSWRLAQRHKSSWNG